MHNLAQAVEIESAAAHPAGLSRRSWHARPLVACAALLVAVSTLAAMVSIIVIKPGTNDAATASPVAVASAPAVVSPATSPDAELPAEPNQGLQATAAADSASVESLVGSWIPQLSSKRAGMTADGQEWDAAAILAEHQSLRAANASTRLVWTGDFANYRGRNFWATVVGTPMPTAAAANAWCDTHGLDSDHCYAVRLTHSGGPNGNAVMRPGR